jgi:uncharacterized protein (DUF58 family)
MLARPRRRLAERVERWARKRQGGDLLPLALQGRRLYILPTRPGLAAALLLFVMLIAGLNYGNSLALFLTFLLAGVALVGMHECQRTLQGLELVQAEAMDCHAGTVGTVELRFANPARQPRRALSLRSPGCGATRFEVAAGSVVSVQAAFQAGQRGRRRLERLELASTAPSGLFRCWTWLYLPVDVFVYPSATGARPLPRARAGRTAHQGAAQMPGEEEWVGLRPYQSGDSPRSIAWKAWARGAPLMVAQYATSDGSDYLFSFDGLESLDLEARLSQLAEWISACARADAACGLRLPGAELPLGRGAAHRALLLRSLALYGTEA